MLVLTSDNGPVIDDGYKDLAEELLGDHTPSSIYRGGKYSIYEAGTRIPFIVHWPDVVKPGVSEALYSQIDLFASMVSLIDGKMPEGHAGDSQNNLPALLGQDSKGRDYIIESSGQLSVSTGEWKYIPERVLKKQNKTVPAQLYNLKEDIAEKNNVAEKYPEKVAELDKILQAEKNK